MSSSKNRLVKNDTSTELRRSSTNMLLDFEYKTSEFKKYTSLRTTSENQQQKGDPRVISRQPSRVIMRSKSTDSKSSEVIRKICCCLLTNQKNDFHHNSSSRKASANGQGPNSKKKTKTDKKNGTKEREKLPDVNNNNSTETSLLGDSKRSANMDKFLSESRMRTQNRTATEPGKDLSSLIKSNDFIEKVNAPQVLESQQLAKKRNSI